MDTRIRRYVVDTQITQFTLLERSIYIVFHAPDHAYKEREIHIIQIERKKKNKSPHIKSLGK